MPLSAPFDTIALVVAALLVLIGLAGIVLPALPGIPLMFAGMLLAAWADDFRHVGAGPMLVLALMTILSLLADFWATALGARRVGASRKALWGSVLGTFAGLFFMPFGLLLGPFLGALIGELWHGSQWRKATHVGLGTWLGLVAAIVLKLTLAFAMLGLFAAAWWL